MASSAESTSWHHEHPVTPEREAAEDIFPVEFSCAACGLAGFNLRACSRCWAVKYCGEQCQRSDWANHQQVCVADAERRNFYKGGRILEVAYHGASLTTPGGDESEVALEDALENAIFLDLDKCPKHGHNQHAAFIGVREFSQSHLPQPLRIPEVVDYVKAESEMTARVLVKWTSKNRPDSDSCARHRGTRFTRTASGLCMLDNPDNFEVRPCPVPNCHRIADLGPEHVVFEGDLKVFTNKHVLFDEDELAKTVVDFFYDSPDKVGVVREYATHLFYTKPSSDKTFFKVTVHDKSLFNKFVHLDLDRSNKFRALPLNVLQRMSSYAIIISHPHGLPKKISIGQVVRRTLEGDTEEAIQNAREAGRREKAWFRSKSEQDYQNYMSYLGSQSLPVVKVWYDTPTCQGSSGGQVLFGGKQVEGTWGPLIANHTAHDLDAVLNYFKVVQFYE